jgi:hypothetical protein
MLASLALLLLMIAGCGGSPNDMVGTWHSQEVTFVVHGVQGSDRLDTLTAMHDEFPERLGILEAIGTYFPDGSYIDNYMLPDSSIVGETTGTWERKGDSIIITQTEPAPMTYRYAVDRDGDQASFTGWVDFDMDGEKDDLFIGTSTRVGPPVRREPSSDE